MFILTVSKDQIEYLLSLIDLDLRTNGLKSLEGAVTLHNAIRTVSRVEGPISDQIEANSTPDNPRA